MPPRIAFTRTLHGRSPSNLPHPLPKPRHHPALLSSPFGSSSRSSAPPPPAFLSSSTSPQPSSALTAANDAVRTMMDVLSRNRPEEIPDDRRRFAAQTLIRPYDLTQSSLYPTRKPGAKPPLLGPSKKVAIQVDPFYQSGTSPIEHTLNPNFTLAFVNSLGRIKGRAETGLTRRSQRRVGKMVRRARAMGLVSKFSDRPAVGGFGSTSSRRGR